MQLYEKVSFRTSRLVTKQYSTSFYWASMLFDKEIKQHIFNIYGFVRFADEIVDTFHNYDKHKLLHNFERDLNEAIDNGISLNPVLNSFVYTVRKFNIPKEYIDAFLESMKMDLAKQVYENNQQFEQYIYGSADVVGLMCLKVFCNGNETLFKNLKDAAMRLGSAFQKVNFLRDLHQDVVQLGRNYFPYIVNNNFDEKVKQKIAEDIEQDFRVAYEGIKMLPKEARLAVLTAYRYYKVLLKKIKQTPAQKIMNRRIRINNFRKLLITLDVLIFERIAGWSN